MISRARTQRAGRGDAVWIEERLNRGMQPNGYVLNIFWSEQEYLVKFYDGGELKGGDVDTYPFDQFEGNFSHRFGGYWHVSVPRRRRESRWAASGPAQSAPEK